MVPTQLFNLLRKVKKDEEKQKRIGHTTKLISLEANLWEEVADGCLHIVAMVVQQSPRSLV